MKTQHMGITNNVKRIYQKQQRGFQKVKKT